MNSKRSLRERRFFLSFSIEIHGFRDSKFERDIRSSSVSKEFITEREKKEGERVDVNEFFR